MSDVSQREWRFYLNDMIDFAGKVLAYNHRLLVTIQFQSSLQNHINSTQLEQAGLKRG
jgi:uncharacterized protein with HEPN domain